MMLFVWFLVLCYLPAASGAALAIVALRGPYAYRGRHHAPGRRRARASTWERSAGLLVDEPDVRAARARTEQIAARIEQRAAEWNDPREPGELAEAWLGVIEHEPAIELSAYDHGAGSERYLDVTPTAIARPGPVRGVARIDLDRRITTLELRSMWGTPVDLDTWDDREDPGVGRHKARAGA